MTRRALARIFEALVGRTVVAVDPHIFDADPAHGRWTSDPTIVFDDGSALSFIVDETEIGEYGIHPVRRKAPRP